MRTMVWHDEGRVCLLVHSQADPTNHEWLAFLNAVSAKPRADRRVLVYTRRGSPNGAQRKELEEIFRHGQKLPTAVITESAVVRAVGAIVMFFNPLLRVFAPADEQKAFDYLGLNPAEQGRARLLRAKLEAEIDGEARAA